MMASGHSYSNSWGTPYRSHELMKKMYPPWLSGRLCTGVLWPCLPNTPGRDSEDRYSKEETSHLTAFRGQLLRVCDTGSFCPPQATAQPRRGERPAALQRMHAGAVSNAHLRAAMHLPVYVERSENVSDLSLLRLNLSWPRKPHSGLLKWELE